jgi:glycosyltransferase involved in cell wall biosynthesis
MSFLYAKKDVAAVKKSNTIIANSQLTKRANSKAYGINESDIEVVYPGVNPERIAPSIPLPELIAKHVKESVPLIFIPKGAQLWRSPETCLKALKRLRTNFKAVFTGGADYEARNLLKRARALGIADEVLWTKDLLNQELSATYLRSSLVISIPKHQSFGLIPLEALLHWSPPIISKTSGVSEVLRDGVEAIHVDENDSEELADAIEKLISDDETRRKIVFNGRRTVLEKLTLTRFIKEVKEKLMS